MTTTAVIIGQGYVGLPLAQAAAAAGIRVIGLDLSERVVNALNAGRSHIDDLSDDAIATMLGQGYSATTDAAAIADADVVVICVPTPLGDAGEPDLGPVIAATDAVAAHLSKRTTVILESTTYPGTTHGLVLPRLLATGKQLDQDFFLAFSPERIDPGNEQYGLKNTPKVVGGVSQASTDTAVAFYQQFVDTVVPVKSAREAETAKLLENTYRHINIALVNEMAQFCHEMNIDLWEVIDAASTKPFGFQAFYPGPGVGGHCIPIDPNYLSFEVQRQLGRPFRFVELAQEINNTMPRYVVERIQDTLNDAAKPLKGSTVLLLGVSYKANIADERESPSRPVAEHLLAKGAVVQYHDPRVPTWKVGADTFESVTDLTAACAAADIVVLLQSHREYDVDALAAASSIFFDTRGKSTIGTATRL